MNCNAILKAGMLAGKPAAGWDLHAVPALAAGVAWTGPAARGGWTQLLRVSM